MTREVEPELLQRLGQIVIFASGVERWVNHLFSTMMQAAPGRMALVTESVSQASITGWIRTLLEILETPPELAQEIRAVLAEIDELRAERNALVHGLWSTTGPPESVVVQTVRFERKDIIKSEVVTLADLDDLVHRFEELAETTFAISRRIGMGTP